jgi:hypothetical protein
LKTQIKILQFSATILDWCTNLDFESNDKKSTIVHCSPSCGILRMNASDWIEYLTWRL